MKSCRGSWSSPWTTSGRLLYLENLLDCSGDRDRVVEVVSEQHQDRGEAGGQGEHDMAGTGMYLSGIS